MSRTEAPVVRPSLPPAAWFCAGVWLAAAGAEAASWRVYAGMWSGAVLWGAPVVALGATVAASVLRRAGPRLLCTGVAVAVLVSCAYWAWWRGEAARYGSGSAGERSAVTLEDATEGPFGANVRLRLDDGAVAVVALPASSTVPAAGSRVRLRGVLKRLDPAVPFSRVAARRGDVCEGRAWSLRVEGWPRGPAGSLMRARASVLAVLERRRGAGVGLLRAVVLGDRRGVSGSEVESDFRGAGLGHLIGASALYVGLAFACAQGLLRSMGAGRRVQLAGGLAVAVAYTVGTGAHASTARGLFTCACVAATAWTGRRRDALATVSLVVAMLILASPTVAFDLGLAIGVSVVCGLSVFGRLAGRWGRAVFPEALGRFVPTASTAAVAQLAALPVSAAAFGMLSLAGPVSAVAVLPVVSFALPFGLGGAALVCVSPRAGVPLLAIAERGFALAALLARAFASIPGSGIALGPLSVPVALGLGAGVVALWVIWPQPREVPKARRGALLLAVALVVALYPPPVSAPGSASLVVMDVGQGDAILLRDGGAAMLVDCGAKPAVLRAALARQAVRRLDCVVLTHAHADHTGGLAGLLSVVDVGWVGAPLVAAEDAFARERSLSARLTPRRPDRWRVLGAGASWKVGGTTVSVLWPGRADARLSANDTSVVMRLERGGDSALLLGDAESEPQDALVRDGGIGRWRVLKVAHHGSVNGLDEAALAAQRPSLALISVGAGNDFGHPAARTLDALERAGARVRRTDREGDLAVTLAGTAVGVADGDAHAPYATIGPARDERAGVPHEARAELHGHDRTRRSQAGLPHIRRRGTAAGTRGPPVARAPLQSGGPRLQLRRLRG